MSTRKPFFDSVRTSLFDGALTQSKVDGMNAVLDVWQKHYASDHPYRLLAYSLATAYHETGKRMVPVRETFASSDRKAVDRLDAAWRKGQLPWVKRPYWKLDESGQYPFGRGLVQTTHRSGYMKVAEMIDEPNLANDYSMMLDPAISAHALIGGIANGIYTGKSFYDYIDDAGRFDATSARAIINGDTRRRVPPSHHGVHALGRTTMGALIAWYYERFLDALDAIDAIGPSEPVVALPIEVPVVDTTDAKTLAHALRALATMLEEDPTIRRRILGDG